MLCMEGYRQIRPPTIPRNQVAEARQESSWNVRLQQGAWQVTEGEATSAVALTLEQVG